MKADPDAQRRLLDVQAIDTALAQLAHRRTHLPENAELERLDGEIRALGDDQARAEAAVADIDRDIARLERDIDQVRQRADRDRARLDAGSGPARELESLQHELASLSRRQTELEDAELELMEQREEAQGGIDTVVGRLATVAAERSEVAARHDATLGEIAADEQRRVTERGVLVATLPGDLLALYERVREQSGGVGAALLRAGRCEGCRLSLPGGDLAQVRAASPDEVVRCEECRRILVRTAESGL